MSNREVRELLKIKYDRSCRHYLQEIQGKDEREKKEIIKLNYCKKYKNMIVIQLFKNK